MALQITERDQRILHDVGVYKFLTTHQIRSLHFAKTNSPTAVTNRLTQLSDKEGQYDGFLSRVFYHPKVSARLGRPTAIFYLTKHNLTNLKEYFLRRGRLSEFTERFTGIEPTVKKDNEWAHASMVHELNISEYYMRYSQLAHDKLPVLFWERTSPRSKDLSEWFTVRSNTSNDKKKTIKTYFNPDGIDCVVGGEEDGKQIIYLNCLEIDNNTESPEYFFNKLLGYEAYLAAQKFGDLFDYFADKYDAVSIAPCINDFDDFSLRIRVRVVVPNDRRRNDLLHAASRLPHSNLYHFTTLPEVQEFNLFSDDIWLNGGQYRAVREKEEAEAQGKKQNVLLQWRDKQAATLQKISFF